jgi:hypothetical protein
MTAAVLTELETRIRRQEEQLQALRQELQDRRDRLAQLSTRKEELQAQLQQVEAEMAALAGADLPAQPAESPGTAARAQAAPAAPPSGGRIALADLIVTMIRQAGVPLTVRQLTVEARRRGHPSGSANFAKMVESRTHELTKKGVLARVADRAGYILVRPQGEAAPAPRAGAAARKGARKGAGRGRAPAPARRVRRGEQAPLREVLIGLLRKSRRPLSGGELAAQAQAAGYRSSSKNLADVVWVTLSKMDDVERVPGKGYRLKQGRA